VRARCLSVEADRFQGGLEEAATEALKWSNRYKRHSPQYAEEPTLLDKCVAEAKSKGGNQSRAISPAEKPSRSSGYQSPANSDTSPESNERGCDPLAFTMCEQRVCAHSARSSPVIANQMEEVKVEASSLDEGTSEDYTFSHERGQNPESRCPGNISVRNIN